MNTLFLARHFHFGVVTYPPGGELGPRHQTRLQLVLIHEGSVTIEVSGHRRRLVAGEITLLLPGNREQFWFDRDQVTRHSWLEASEPQVEAETLEWLATAPHAVPFSTWLEKLVRRGFQARNQADNAFQAQLIQQLGPAAFLQFLLDADMPPPKTRDHPDALRKATRIISDEFASPLDLTTLAKRSGVSAQHLMRLCRQHLGTSPIRKLWQVRAQEAERLIRSTGLALAEIAEQTGYQNAFHMSRQIRQRTGYSPRQLREMQWGRS